MSWAAAGYVLPHLLRQASQEMRQRRSFVARKTRIRLGHRHQAGCNLLSPLSQPRSPASQCDKTMRRQSFYGSFPLRIARRRRTAPLVTSYSLS